MTNKSDIAGVVVIVVILAFSLPYMPHREPAHRFDIFAVFEYTDRSKLKQTQALIDANLRQGPKAWPYLEKAKLCEKLGDFTGGRQACEDGLACMTLEYMTWMRSGRPSADEMKKIGAIEHNLEDERDVLITKLPDAEKIHTLPPSPAVVDAVNNKLNEYKAEDDRMKENFK